MNTVELMAMIKTAHQLGHREITLYIDESRDGELHYARASARMVTAGHQSDPQTLLVIGYADG